jgi:uncharacterized protein YbcI
MTITELKIEPAYETRVDDAPAERSASRAVKISNLVVQAFRAHTGRGPTKARTTFDLNLITVVLRDTLTNGERSLVAAGRTELVIEMRRAYQEMMREELIAGVEELSGRKVAALLSDTHLDPDIAVAAFVLEQMP